MPQTWLPNLLIGKMSFMAKISTPSWSCLTKGITKPCTQLHQAPSTSTNLHPAHFNLQTSSIHLRSAHFSLHPALCNTLNNIWTKILHVIGQFPQILTKNWHTWYFGGADSESRLRFLKFRPQNPLLGKFRLKNSKLSSENWYTWYLKDADSESRPRFLKFWPQNPFLVTQSCPFCLEIGTYAISMMLILISTLFFWISNPNFLFGKIWTKKIKIVPFNWKLVHMVSWKCRFLIRT